MARELVGECVIRSPAVPASADVDGRLTVRVEESRDVAAVRDVEEGAFGRASEADLVDALRESGDVTLSLVAEVDGALCGHVLFTPVTVTGAGGEWRAVALGPLAVAPDVQRRGVGSALVRAGLAACARAGDHVVFVLGHPTYYPRFGFRSTAPFGIAYEQSVSPEAFMVAELRPGALADRTGTVRYAPPFRAT